MINQGELRAECVRNGYTLDKLARTLGINISTLSRKINGKVEFTCAEMQKLRSCLHLDDTKIMTIFFDNEVAEKQQTE